MLTRCSRKFQSTGLSGRSLEDLVHLIAPSFKLSWKATTKPKRIVYPTDFASLLSDKQNALMDEFVTAWEKTLNVKADRISLADAWVKNPPQDAGNKQPLGDYLGNVSKTSTCFCQVQRFFLTCKKQATYDAFCYGFYHNYDTFRSAFKAKFGEAPYAEPNVAEQWCVFTPREPC